jgi:hypothetical protein
MREKCIKRLVQKVKELDYLGRPRSIWDSNTEVVIKEIGWTVLYWINLAQD